MAFQLGEAYGKVIIDTEAAKKGIASLGGAVKSSGKLLTGATLGAAGTLVSGIAAVGVSAGRVSLQTQRASADMAASLGMPIEEAERFASVARDVYGNNFGETMADAAGAITEVTRQMGLLADDPSLQATAEKAIALRDSFGVEVSESVAAAKELMNEFGLSSDEAFDFIAAGYQKGLDSSGDFMDTIGEFSTQFSEGGASAEQFFSLMESGLTAGTLGTDKAADAFKEFRLRILDGSDATSEGLGLLMDDQDVFLQQIEDGTITVADAFGIVTDLLADTEDPMTRMQSGASLLGTQFEDMGDDAVAALSLTGTSMDDLAGSADDLNAKYESVGEMMSGIWRQLITEMSPVTDIILEQATEAMPAIQEAITSLIPVLVDMASNIGPVIEQAAAWVQSFAEMSPETRRMIGIGIAVAAALGPLITIFSGIATVVGTLAPILSGLASVFGLILSPAFLIVGAIAGLAAVLLDLGGAGEFAQEKLRAMGFEGLADWLEGVNEKATALKDTIGGLISGELKISDFEMPTPQWILDIQAYEFPEFTTPQWILDLEAYEFPELTMPEWVEGFKEFRFPELETPDWIEDLEDFEFPEFTQPEWVKEFLKWAWPVLDEIEWVVNLVEWMWPDLEVSQWVVDLVKWAWPDFEPIDWIVELLDWDWPSLPDAGWFSDLFDWDWPSLPKLPGFLGGGGGDETRAAGGPVTRGQTYLVGEEGQELFTPSRSGYIHDHGSTMEMMNQGSTVNITVNAIVNSELDEYRLAKRLADIYRRGY